MDLAADLDQFLARHRAHGRMKTSLGGATPDGYQLAVACRCGVKFERRVTMEVLLEGLFRNRRRGKPVKRRVT